MSNKTSISLDIDYLCWVLSDDIVGKHIQCLGLAAASGLNPVIKHIKPSWLLRAVPLIGQLASIIPTIDCKNIDKRWPEVIISCGRSTAGVALAVRCLATSQPFLAHIQDPHIHPRHFDMLIVPEHDQIRGENVITTFGSLNYQEPKQLTEAAKPWLTKVATLPRPLIAINVGGSNKRYNFSSKAVSRFVKDLRTMSQSTGGSLLVACSRRTSDTTKVALLNGLNDLPGIIWTGSGKNPYLAFLYLCEAFVVTSDSVNMISEACSTGKPLHVATIEQETGKLAAFHNRLRNEGYTRPFVGRLEHWTYKPLDETNRVGAIMKQRLAKRFSALKG
ncbi:hypothetical protein A1OE_1275 [Candidatus Endolissoclinum faulkneri L2]|uniref:Mitochondrial fission ELM1 family protein n=1 Tax=Candidatus Endolissoclinum faulkneri L2 TaxID=1193729 RepID=K7YSG1_9PROT|nr:mitochondrial fission ELM1 family protein [Candidatus Endolissoclinum faulkneri]AFX99449.1 hypothetical protein A1OE_1275 [Candidatus Endolissoclinum faulkneri L2]